MNSLRNMTLSLVVGCALLAIPLNAQRSPFVVMKVTAIIHDQNDCDPNNPADPCIQYLTRSDDYSGTTFATYNELTDPNIKNTIAGDGNSFWSMYLLPGTDRKIWLTLNSRSETPILPDGDYLASAPAEIFSQCWNRKGNSPMSWETMKTGASLNHCSFGVIFAYGGIEYKLLMRPNKADATNTGWAKVTCRASTTKDGCTRWEMVPNMDPEELHPTVANLYKCEPTCTGSNSLITVLGEYRNTFRIEVTYP